MFDPGLKAAFFAMYRGYQFREARASCALDGSTQCAGDFPPYVLTPDRRLITEKQWKREQESEEALTP